MSELKKPITYASRISPNQSFGSFMYEDSEDYTDRLYSILQAYSKKSFLSPDHYELSSQIGFEEMTTPTNQLALFAMALGISKAKNVLEIGTFIGRSTIEFTRMLGGEGHVTTIEAYEEFADIAERNFKKNGLSEKITLLRGDAKDLLKNLSGPFDFIFIDGSKQDYLSFTLQATELVSENGIIVVDDIFFHGDAINNNPTTLKGKGCKETLEYFQNYTRCKKVIIPAWNGVLLLYGFDKKCK